VTPFITNLSAFQARLAAGLATPADQTLLGNALATVLTSLATPGPGGLTEDDTSQPAWFAPLYAIGQGAGGGTVGPAPGTPAYNPTFYAYTTIYIDPQNSTGNASDANPGNSNLAPRLTWASVIQSFGSTSPLFNAGQSMSFTFMSSQAPGVDPIFFSPLLTGGGQAVLIGTPVAPEPAFLAGAVTAKSRTVGGNALAVNIAAYLGTAKQGLLVVNTTRSSQAMIASLAAPVATLSQPFTIASLATTAVAPNPVEVDTWAVGDSLTIYFPCGLNLKEWNPIGGDETAAAQPTAGWVFDVEVYDPSGLALSQFEVDCRAAVLAFVNCAFDGRTGVRATAGRGNNAYFIGTYHTNLVFQAGGDAYFSGAIMEVGFTQVSGQSSILGDSIVHGPWSLQGNAAAVGPAFADGTLVVSGSVIRLLGPFYGSYGVTVRAQAAVEMDVASTFAATLLTSGVLQFGSGTTTGSAYVAATGLWTALIALTPANIDANTGLQDASTGGRFCFQQGP